MANPISGIGGLQALMPSSGMQALAGRQDGSNSSFQDLLLQSLQQVNSIEQTGQQAIQESLTGGEITQVEVFSAVKQADLALRMMLQIRNRVMEAYNEIKQMQL